MSSKKIKNPELSERNIFLSYDPYAAWSSPLMISDGKLDRGPILLGPVLCYNDSFIFS